MTDDKQIEYYYIKKVVPVRQRYGGPSSSDTYKRTQTDTHARTCTPMGRETGTR
jgi:hypothetical protein